MDPAFLSGVSLAAFTASGVFFLRFWRKSGDRFHLMFCGALWLLAVERLVLLVVDTEAEHAPGSVAEATNAWVYVIRLLAFLTILVAILDKNRASNKV